MPARCPIARLLGTAWIVTLSFAPSVAATSGAATVGAAMFASSASAQGAASRRAARLLEEGSAAFGRGDYAIAIEAFGEAYRVSRHPVALYNLARAHEGAGQLEQAAAHYREYLRLQPDDQAASARLEAVNAEIAAARAAAAEASVEVSPVQASSAQATVGSTGESVDVGAELDAPRDSTPEDGGGGQAAVEPWGGLTLAGVGLAGAIAAAAFFVVGSDVRNTADELGISHTVAIARFEDSERWYVAGNVAVGLAIALAVGAAAWLVVSAVQTRDTPQRDRARLLEPWYF